ncbi:cytochrome P450 [Dacryopinax primogenitus]|uniref:Cytochrome P450 n=1 Tax=Dacryopinax primogenitus (strain DJM 731) TaxID=1858805 RepID=M5FVH5_DACPD|nr:cytochrome P450 [Dacryopinax primogenitus]EJU01811.1 cytochrome P450 [Dacryopinax primogenitus]
MRASQATTRRIGMQLVREKKAAVMQEMERKGDVEKSKIVGRDLLSTLIRANMAADLAPAHRMRDEEVLAQISTFIIAGHETTASGVTWALYSLAQNPEIQEKLRAELSQVSEEAPSMDEVNALPYLDMVVKESLRFHSPVHGTMRVAATDDEIPLAQPVIDEYGKSHDTIKVQAGDYIGVDVILMNKSKALWGEDADKFRPERWEEDLNGANDIPGVYSHLMSFIGGPRACIGYRFSIIEAKALLFVLLRSFEFAPVPGQEIGIKNVIVARPFVKGQEKSLALPMIIKKVTRS